MTHHTTGIDMVIHTEDGKTLFTKGALVWELFEAARSWGIKELEPSMYHLHSDPVLDDDGKEIFPQYLLTFGQTEFTTNNIGIENKIILPFYPRSAEIHVKTKKIDIYFE